MTDTPPLTAALEASRTYPLVDARCTHRDCAGKTGVYRMVGHCRNCGAGPLLLLVTSGHSAPSTDQCPRCQCWTVGADRLAHDDELPESAP